jgi:hypothetical protein
MVANLLPPLPEKIKNYRKLCANEFSKIPCLDYNISNHTICLGKKIKYYKPLYIIK